MHNLRSFVRRLIRFIVVWVIDAISLLVTAAVVPGINLQADGTTPTLVVAMATALVLGIVNIFVRPIILMLSLPFGIIAVFVVGLLVNAIVLMVTSWLMPAFEVSNWLVAFIGGLIFAAVNALVTSIVTLSEEDSFYQKRIEALARRRPFPNVDPQKPGLVMLEIDGLSYWHVHKAIDEGWMPALSSMLENDNYALTRTDCGLPSQTSACQSGIMFGDNSDIPAFRWFDKDEQRLFVSGHDAAEINARYAKGAGLMRGGSSINNMMNGDASKSLLTLAAMRSGTSEEKKDRARDVYLLMINPYFFMRTLVLFFVDVVRELWEGWRQKANNVEPRLDRTKHWYPFVRAATTVLMREISANLAVLDIIRGSPSIYVTWPGYDEVAHHSGPWTTDAFKTLRQFDEVIERVRNVIEYKAPRPYELIILSDHGQSFGATFKQRYGRDLKSFIEENLPQGTTVTHTSGGDDGTLSMSALGSELQNIQEAEVGNAAGRAVAGQTQKLMQQSVDKQTATAAATPAAAAAAQVVVCGSGNIAQVYFDLFPRKIKLGELNTAYPGMVDTLVQHEGVGFVVGCADDGAPTVLGKQGTRNLRTGAVTGQDPLLPFAVDGVATPELRAEQICRIADFPHAGDLMVNSPVFADGTVAAMEELIGCHGGLGGEQTDAFICHPASLPVPATKNSADVFGVLNGWRDLPASAGVTRAPVQEGINGWAPAALAKGLGAVSLWLGRAARCVVLDSGAYREVVHDPHMNGPAVLLALLSIALTIVLNLDRFDPAAFFAAIGVWLLATLVVFGAARALGGTGDFSSTLRATGFARSADILLLLVFFAPLAPMARLLSSLLIFFGTWLGAAQAHSLKRWRSLVLPVAAIAVVLVGMFVIELVLAGASFTLDTFLSTLGLSPQS